MEEDHSRASANASHGEKSRHAILREARFLFASEGYASVSIDRVLAGLNLTKGSFYHHFEDKKALFKDVVAEVQLEVATRAKRHETTQSAGEALLETCHSFFSDLQRADVMRIICRDAGSILTSTECTEIDEGSGQNMGVMRRVC
jgi:AcrR family transcriptional regulator